MVKAVMREHREERFAKVFNFCDNPPLPRSLNIELNSGCNQKCIFCPFHGKYAPEVPASRVIPVDKVIKILDEARRLGIGEKEVGFYLAGEVFLYNDLPKVIAYAKSVGFKYTFITTNGALATPDKMKAVLDAGLDSIRISINASNRESYKLIHGKDDFDKVLENIKFMHQYIVENQLTVATSISCVLTKKTLNEKDDVKKIFGQYVDDIIFMPVLTNRLRADEEFVNEHQLIDDADATINPDFVCPILFDTMYINANMDVVPCCEAYDHDCTFFDLKEELDLEKAWNSDAYKKYRRIFLYGEDDSDTICETCMLRMKGLERYTIE